jgi:hypothetical protein
MASFFEGLQPAVGKLISSMAGIRMIKDSIGTLFEKIAAHVDAVLIGVNSVLAFLADMDVFCHVERSFGLMLCSLSSHAQSSFYATLCGCPFCTGTEQRGTDPSLSCAERKARIVVVVRRLQNRQGERSKVQAAAFLLVHICVSGNTTTLAQLITSDNCLQVLLLKKICQGSQ